MQAFQVCLNTHIDQVFTQQPSQTAPHQGFSKNKKAL